MLSSRCAGLISGRVASRLAFSNGVSRIVRSCSTTTTGCSTATDSSSNVESFVEKVKKGPSLSDFMSSSSPSVSADLHKLEVEEVPYLSPEDVSGNQRKVFFQTYGCQMNVNDTEIACAILEKAGYVKTAVESEADVILIVTCAIRDKAEQKIWARLRNLAKVKKTRKGHLKVALLGCMAERLKEEVLEKEKCVDVVAGPDAYRDLPRLLAVAGSGEKAINVQLSFEETYADVTPVRLTPSNLGAFISIMRGCDNMCSYCIVPFTRGKERSRDMTTIIDEVRHLSDQGVKEIVLLGQNVNSYRDVTPESFQSYGERYDHTHNSAGFKTIYKNKEGGLRFADLLHEVVQINREIRFGFTAPHPKDFPDQLLDVINENDNVFKYVHIPAQCGSTRVLELMRRGHTREAYLDIVKKIRERVKDVTLSTDMIVGFCGETHEDYLETLSLVDEVRYEMGFLFAYSMRKKTHAHRKMEDDVPAAVKRERLIKLNELFNQRVVERKQLAVGREELVLLENDSTKSSEMWCGRDNSFMQHIVPKVPVPCAITGAQSVELKKGDYVRVRSQSCTMKTYMSPPLERINLQLFFEQQRRAQSSEHLRA